MFPALTNVRTSSVVSSAPSVSSAAPPSAQD